MKNNMLLRNATLTLVLMASAAQAQVFPPRPTGPVPTPVPAVCQFSGKGDFSTATYACSFKRKVTNLSTGATQEEFFNYRNGVDTLDQCRSKCNTARWEMKGCAKYTAQSCEIALSTRPQPIR